VVAVKKCVILSWQLAENGRGYPPSAPPKSLIMNKSPWQIRIEKQREEYAWLKSLAPEERRKFKEEFEQKMRVWADKFYRDRGYSIERQNYTTCDLIVSKEGRKLIIEEKFRTRVYADLAIELIQDVTPRAQDWRMDWRGWFYTCKADYLLVAFTNSILDEEPEIAYMVNLHKLKLGLKEALFKGVRHSYIDSKAGWEYYTAEADFSINLCVPWQELVMLGITEKVYQKENLPC